MVFSVQPPSVFLPQIKGIKNCSRKDLADAIARLRDIYIHPQVRGSTRRRRLSETEAAHSSFSAHKISHAERNSKPGDQDLTSLSADSFERKFAIQWLTRFISICCGLPSDTDDEGVEALEQAAALLAVCAGTAACGRVERIFAFPFTSLSDLNLRKEGDRFSLPNNTVDKIDGHVKNADPDQIRVALRDAPLESADFSSVGAQTWGASCVLAEMIAEHPENFGIFGDTIVADGSISGRMRLPFRALELGAGTGLASLVLGKVLERVRPPTRAHVQVPGGSDTTKEKGELDLVVATDFHPSVLANLKENVERNFPVSSGNAVASSIVMSPGPHVVALPLDWSSIYELSSSGYHTQTSQKALLQQNNTFFEMQAITSAVSGLSPVFVAPFDLIIGADIIYEPLHAKWVRSWVEIFLKRPSIPTTNISCTTHTTAPSLPPTQPECPITVSDFSLSPARFHLIIPLRRTHSFESRTVEEVFPLASEVLALRKATHYMAPSHAASEDDGTINRGALSSSTSVLAILSQEDIVCDAYSDRAEGEVVVYRYFKIGWV